MDENTDIALRGVRYAQDQFSEVVSQAEEFVREKPGQSLLIALIAGMILNRLPIGRLFGGVVRLLMKSSPSFDKVGAAVHRTARATPSRSGKVNRPYLRSG